MPQVAIFIAALRDAGATRVRRGRPTFSERVAWRALIGSSFGVFSIRFVLWFLLLFLRAGGEMSGGRWIGKRSACRWTV